jgi:hypothetical protein
MGKDEMLNRIQHDNSWFVSKDGFSDFLRKYLSLDFADTVTDTGTFLRQGKIR